MKPYIRDYLFCGGNTAGPTYSIDVKAGDLVIAYHANYSTTVRLTATLNPGVAIGSDYTSSWRVGATAATGAVWVTRAKTDYTATLGPGVTWSAGSYGVTQMILCLRGVKHLASHYLNAADPSETGPLTVGQSGRPYTWTSATSGPISTTNFALEGVDVGVLSIGSWLWDSASKYGPGEFLPGPAETLLSWDDVAYWRHTCLAVGWYSPETCKTLASEAGDGYVYFYGNNVNSTGSPSIGVGVSFAVVPEEYPPSADELWFGDTATSATPGDTLTVEASAGDQLLFATACQYGSQADHTPDGWTGVYGTTASGGRSGTIAVRKADSSGTVSLAVPSTTGGRIAASLAVMRGVGDLVPTPWEDGPPTLPDGPCLVLVNANAVNTAANTSLDQTTDIIVDHEATRSSSASWTGCGIYYVADGGGATATFQPTSSTTFSAWAVIPLTSGGEEPTPGLPSLCMGDGTVVTLVGWWDGTQLLPAEFVGVGA